MKEKICRNRTEADSFEEWAKENCTECPECYNIVTEGEIPDKLFGVRRESTKEQ